jgi:Cu/Ag efflux pump CusA
MLRINIYQNSFNWKEQAHQRILRFILQGRDYVVMVFIYAVIAAAIIWKYGTYFLPEFLYS